MIDHSMTPPSPLRVMRLPEVKQRTGLSRSSIYRLMGEARFPKSCKLGERIIAWVEADIDRWLAEKIASSRHQSVDRECWNARAS